MPNTFQSTNYVLNEVFVRFVNYLQFTKTCNRNLEDDFKNLRYATGQTLNYRLEERYLANRGATAAPQDRVQVIRPLTIDTQFHAMVQLSGFELTFDRARDKPYLDEMLNPRAKALANDVEKYVAEENLAKQVYQATGTPGVAVDFNTIATTDAYMTELAVPNDGERYVGVNPRVAAQLANDLRAVFQTEVIDQALLEGFIGRLSDFQFFKSVFMGRQIAGTGGVGAAPAAGFLDGGTITGPVASGSTLTVTGLNLSQQVFNEGDRIELDPAAGVYMVNPLTQAAITDQTAQFVVTADVTSDGAGNATVPISPAIVTSGARQNISQAIPNGTAIWLRDSHNVNIAYHRNAIVFAAPQLAELRGGVEATTVMSDLYKMAMTYSLGADITNYLQLDRIDMIAGVSINPEFAVCICS